MSETPALRASDAEREQTVTARGNDTAPHAGTPLVRVYAFSLSAGIDVWRSRSRGGSAPGAR